MASTKPNIIIQTAFLGDLLLAIPLLKEIKKTFPNQKLYLICREGLGSLLKNLGLVDVFFEVKKGDRDSYKKILKEISSLEFENLFCPHMSMRSALFSLQLKAEKKVGYDEWWNSFVFNEKMPRDINLPDALRQLSLMAPFDNTIAANIDQYADEHSISILGPVPEWASMDVHERIQFELPKELQSIDESRGAIKIACLFPGSVWATKQWTVNGFIEIARRLTKEKFKVLILGSKPELSIGEEIAKEVPGSENWIAKTKLEETLAIIKYAKIVVTNDSAGQHLAAVAGVPTVSIFGPTVLELGYRPWNPRADVVENKNITCRPCGKHGHQKCPVGTHVCMISVTADMVWESIKKKINQ